MNHPAAVDTLFARTAPEQVDGAVACMLIGLACRGAAHLLEAPAQARLAAIFEAAGVPAGTSGPDAAPALLAYLEDLNLDPKVLQEMEAALLRDIETQKQGDRRASTRLLGGRAMHFQARTALPAPGTIRVGNLAPPRRLR